MEARLPHPVRFSLETAVGMIQKGLYRTSKPRISWTTTIAVSSPVKK